MSFTQMLANSIASYVPGVRAHCRSLTTAAAAASSGSAAALSLVKKRGPVSATAGTLPPDTGILPPRKFIKPRKRPSSLVRPEGVLPPFVAEYTISRSTTAGPPGRMSASNALGREAAAKLGSYGASAPSGEGEAPIEMAASAEGGADARSGSASGSAETEGAGRGLVMSEQPPGGEGRESTGRKRRLRLKDMAEGPRKLLIGRREASRALALAFPRGVTPDTLFAVVNLGGRQYKVCEGDVIVAERLNASPVSSSLTLPVALLGSRSRTVIGRPTVPGVHVLATVEEHARGSKVIVFKKKRRKRYQRTQGHRRDVTRLRVTAIAGEGIATF